ncbi:hypothetical protein F5890DRAFT_907886 [Lentinula detonsa]|uniref:Uncharacterized protein n=1 Tax=Lentinula detonsa TaxID=2804962 RepID=A0AA38Q3X2_9AGAR|nr:hypothetical protein F5890DRAFT_907886 [Lentinula detonsa]
MHFQKLLAVCILLISCHGAIASPLNIGGASPGGGLRAVTSNTASSDDDKVVELERRAEVTQLLPIGFVILRRIGYGVVFLGKHSIMKGKDNVFYKELNEQQITYVSSLESGAHFTVPVDISAEISALTEAIKEDNGCKWILEAVKFWRQVTAKEKSLKIPLTCMG